MIDYFSGATVFVDQSGASVFLDTFPDMYKLSWPDVLSEWILDFDDGNVVEPVEVEITIA